MIAKTSVVEARGSQGNGRVRRRRSAPTPPTTTGIASGRKSSGRSSSRVRLDGGDRGEQRADGAIPMSASATPAIVAPPIPEKKSAKAGSATSSAATRKASMAIDFAEPDRAAVARREQEPVDQPLLPLGDERARQAEERREDDRDPEQALGGEVGAVAPAGRSGRRRASRRRRGASPGSVSRAPAARAAGPSARARRRRRSSASCEREPVGRERLDARRVVGRDDEGRARRGARRARGRAARRRRRRAR